MQREDFIGATATAFELIRREEVRSAWDGPSALERMTVGMLACHLGRQFSRTVELMSASAGEDGLGTGAESDVLEDAAAHYRRAAWVTAASLDEPSMDRSNDRAEADRGFDALITRCDEAISRLDESIRSPEPEIVTIPWQGWSLKRDDFLLTRLVEIVVHTDDLARSIEVATPIFGDGAFHPVLHLLADLAAHRHGQGALISALTRRERQPANVSAF